MRTVDIYQGAADSLGVALYLYPDGSVSNLRKTGIEPFAMIEPREQWKPGVDHGLGEQIRSTGAPC